MKQNLKTALGTTFVERPNQVAVTFGGRDFTRGELATALAPYATPAAAIRAARLLKRFHIREWRTLIRAHIEGIARIRGMGDASLWATIQLIHLGVSAEAVDLFLGDNTVTWDTLRKRAHTRARKHKQPAP